MIYTLLWLLFWQLFQGEILYVKFPQIKFGIFENCTWEMYKTCMLTTMWKSALKTQWHSLKVYVQKF